MEKKHENTVWVPHAETLPEPAGPGVTRRVLAYNKGLMCVENTFEKGAVGALHSPLVDSFNTLRESDLNADQIKRQVGELVKTVEDPSLLQETLIAVVTGSMGSGQTEWGMNVITDALRDRESLEDLIVRSLLRLRKEGGAARSNDFVQQMLAYMNAHYADEALSLQYIADNVVYMNADYIGREFTRSVGQKFSSQLLSIRMEHAKLLIRSDPSLHSYEIAEKVGLGENPHYFSQLFRKYTGMTPKDYRKQLDEQTGQG